MVFDNSDLCKYIDIRVISSHAEANHENVAVRRADDKHLAGREGGICHNKSCHIHPPLRLRRKWNAKKKPEELKGAKCPFQIKKYFYGRIKDEKFALYSITLNKRRVYDRLAKDKERVYNYIARLVFDQIPFGNAEGGVEIVIDRSKTKRNIQEFNRYIIQQIKTQFDPKVPLRIRHEDSKVNGCLQAVDLFCWGIQRKYEHNDTEWLDIYKDKVIYDEQYL